MVTPFDEWYKNKEKVLVEKFGTLAAKELRSEMYSSFEFGASIGFKQGRRQGEDDF